MIWGTKLEEDGNEYFMTEDRGMRIALPKPLVSKSLTEKDLPLKYKVRNYFTFNELGIIHFEDARLVSIQTN